MNRHLVQSWGTTLIIGLVIMLYTPAAHAATACAVGTIEDLRIAGESVISATQVAAAPRSRRTLSKAIRCAA